MAALPVNVLHPAFPDSSSPPEMTNVIALPASMASAFGSDDPGTSVPEKSVSATDDPDPPLLLDDSLLVTLVGALEGLSEESVDVSLEELAGAGVVLDDALPSALVLTLSTFWPHPVNAAHNTAPALTTLHVVVFMPTTSHPCGHPNVGALRTSSTNNTTALHHQMAESRCITLNQTPHVVP